MGQGRRDRRGEGWTHSPPRPPGQDIEAWWSRWEREDPPATHLVTFRPVVQVRVALAPGVDPDRVLAEAVAAWAGELSGEEPAEDRARAECWGASLGDAGLVVGVEHIDAGYSVEANP